MKLTTKQFERLQSVLRSLCDDVLNDISDADNLDSLIIAYVTYAMRDVEQAIHEIRPRADREKTARYVTTVLRDCWNDVLRQME